MKKDNSQTRWERKQRKELLQREQAASGNSWYDKMNFYIRDFSFEKFFQETFGKKKGFTLIEAGVCMAIIVILVAISLPIYLDVLAKGKAAAQTILSLSGK